MGKVCTPSELKQELEALRASSQIVFTNGCFDILHVGHVKYLQKAKSLGDVLVVGVNSDASVKGLKGPERPVQVEQDRLEVLAGLGAVDFVTLFSEATPIRLIELVKPDFLVKGGDWPVEKIVGHDFVSSYGGKTLSLPFIPGRSSSSLIEKIKKLG